MAASDAAVGVWNHTGLLTSWQACPKTEVYRERVDEGILSHSIFTEVVLSLNNIMQDRKEKKKLTPSMWASTVQLPALN